MRLIDADALKAEWYRLNDINEEDCGARFVGYQEIARLINNAPTVEPTGDLISRADALEAVRKELVCDGRHETHDKTCRFIADVLLSALPSADAVQGEWIDENGNNVPLHKDGYPLRSCYCNQCHEWLVASDEYEVKGNFCPNCGARMKGGND